MADKECWRCNKKGHPQYLCQYPELIKRIEEARGLHTDPTPHKTAKVKHTMETEIGVPVNQVSKMLCELAEAQTEMKSYRRIAKDYKKHLAESQEKGEEKEVELKKLK